MIASDKDDQVFKEYTKREIINGFLQKPIKKEVLCLEVNREIHIHKNYV